MITLTRITISISSMVLFLSLFSCQQETTRPEPPADPEVLAQIERGKKLSEALCVSCHSATAPLNGRLAPPLAAVQSHYLEPESTLTSFSSEIINFVKNPTPDKSKMRGAMRRFGLMPKQEFVQEELEAIATYLYYGEIDAPGWLAKHQKEEMAQQQEQRTATDSIAEKGRAYALKVKSTLGANLMAAIKAGGPAHAVDFCNTRAISLTDSVSNTTPANIRRVSDRPRNPDNQASSLELSHIEALKIELANGGQNPYRLLETEEGYVGYYPIMTGEMCLQCHGRKDADIQSATLAALAERYPNDRATEYAANQLRGVWVVEMPNRTDK